MLLRSAQIEPKPAKGKQETSFSAVAANATEVAKKEAFEAGTQTLTFRDSVKGTVNAGADKVKANVRRNIRRPLPQVMAYPANDYKMALLCGGPSLAEFKKPRGYKIATVNNTHNWAIENGLKPSVYAQLDARESNARFTATPVDGCRYLLCSQVHPSVFDQLEGYDVRIWHSPGEVERKLLNKYYLGRWTQIPGGSTIGSRMLFLLYVLGIRTIRVYGMDSSYAKGSHHAYQQAENDRDKVVTAKVGRRKFKTTVWMLAQLDEMLQLSGSIPADLKLSFEGDGLLQYVISETARRGKVPPIKLES